MSSSSFFPLIFMLFFEFLLICHIFGLFILFITYYLSYLECKLQVQGSLSVLLIDAFQISRLFLSHHNHLINIY